MTILERLRSETASLHAAVEREAGLVDRALTRERYRLLLARLYAFHAALEPAIARALDDPAFFEPRRRLDRLAADLDALGAGARPAPAAAAGTGPAGEAAAFGALYVLEGSRLGGRIVARHLAALLGIGPGGGASYFAGEPGETARLWHGFGDRLTARAPALAADAVVAGAVATFEAFRTVVCPPSEGAPAWPRIRVPT